MRLHQRIRREQAKHTDDWLITYADTITLLLCLFVIILSIKSVAKHPTPEAAVPVVEASIPSDVFWGASVRPVPEEATDATLPVAAGPVASDDVPNPAHEAPVPVGSAHEAVSAPTPVARPVLPPAAKTETGWSSLPAVVDRLKSQGTPIIAQRGDRITTLQIGSAAFFSSGSAALSNAGKFILTDVAVTLKSNEFAAYHITIEGHTDDTPISTSQFQSNWELSAARAAAVVRFLLDLGVPAGKLTAAGYADTLPIAPNRTADGTVLPENQARNRRVVIRMERIDKAER